MSRGRTYLGVISTGVNKGKPSLDDYGLMKMTLHWLFMGKSCWFTVQLKEQWQSCVQEVENVKGHFFKLFQKFFFMTCIFFFIFFPQTYHVITDLTLKLELWSTTHPPVTRRGLPILNSGFLLSHTYPLWVSMYKHTPWVSTHRCVVMVYTHPYLHRAWRPCTFNVHPLGSSAFCNN